jgi:phosphoribosylformylglycinamidine synthase subunit PurL
MLSESQERMLIIVKRGREAEVQKIFDKWDLPWAEVGIVTDTGRMVVKNRGQLVADIPAKKLADEAPIYQRESREPAYMKAVREFTLNGIADTTDAGGDLKKLLAWPTIASKNWVYRQYDYLVRDNTIVAPGSDAAVLRIKEDSLPPLPDGEKPKPFREKFIALSVDCNAVYVYLDPYEGGKIAVAECARNLACSGATPLGTTDNLNFANPHNPELFYQLRKSVEGLAEGCRAFNAPVTGGNVSLYNQSPAGPIDPTPTVAMVGIVEKAEHITTQWFKDEGDVVVLLGDAVDANDPLQGLGGSAYLQVIRGKKTGLPPRIDLAKEKNLHDTLRALIRGGLVKSAHDCSEGGLAVALAESCISNHRARGTDTLIGATIDLSSLQSQRTDALLFGETQSRVVVSCSPQNADKLLSQAKSANVSAMKIGTVGGARLVIKAKSATIDANLEQLHDAWWNSIARAMAS